MGTGYDHVTFVLLKSHQGHTSQVYSLEKRIAKQQHLHHQMQVRPQHDLV